MLDTSIINWLKKPDQYISITTSERTNDVWGLDWALANGTTEVNRWESLQEFFSYLSDLALPADPNQAPYRPREIALYTDDLGLINQLTSNPDSPFIILSQVLSSEPEVLVTFEKMLSAHMEETGVSPTFRAIWFEQNPTNEYRSDIRDLLITLVKI